MTQVRELGWARKQQGAAGTVVSSDGITHGVSAAGSCSSAPPRGYPVKMQAPLTRVLGFSSEARKSRFLCASCHCLKACWSAWYETHLVLGRRSPKVNVICPTKPLVHKRRNQHRFLHWFLCVPGPQQEPQMPLQCSCHTCTGRWCHGTATSTAPIPCPWARTAGSGRFQTQQRPANWQCGPGAQRGICPLHQEVVSKRRLTEPRVCSSPDYSWTEMGKESRMQNQIVTLWKRER